MYHTFTVTQWDTWRTGLRTSWYFPASVTLLIANGLGMYFLPTEHLMDETAAPQEPAFREDLAAMIWSIAPDLPAINQHTAIPDMPQADYTGTPYEASPRMPCWGSTTPGLSPVWTIRELHRNSPSPGPRPRSSLPGCWTLRSASRSKQKGIFMSTSTGFLAEFKTFIARGNVLDLAVGVIIGGAFSAITTSLVNDIINPILGIFTGGNEALSALASSCPEAAP